jgi:hypothetical protein
MLKAAAIARNAAIQVDAFSIEGYQQNQEATGSNTPNYFYPVSLI